MKRALALLLVTMAACDKNPADLDVAALAASVDSGDHQATQVGTAAAQPLAVRVTVDGVPRAGVAVGWTTESGSITESSVTNASGIATARWTLGVTAGERTAVASVRTSSGYALSALFSGTAVAGPATTIVAAAGDGQSRPANYGINEGFEPVVVVAKDVYGNPTKNAVVQWVVVSGALVLEPFASSSPAAIDGRVSQPFHHSGVVGSARIRATLAGTSSTVLFTETVTTAEYGVVLQYDYDAEDYPYGSVYNFLFSPNRVWPGWPGTFPVGSVFRWTNNMGAARFMQIELTGPVSLAPPPVVGANGSYAVTLTVPGTYSYAASGYPRAMGKIIVK